MILIEQQDGMVQTDDNGGQVEIKTYTSFLAALGLKTVLLQKLSGEIQTLWFNANSYVVKELIPKDVIGFVKKEFGVF